MIGPEELADIVLAEKPSDLTPRTLEEAVILAGGTKRVAARLGMSQQGLRRWVQGSFGADLTLRQMERLQAALAEASVVLSLADIVVLAYASRGNYARRRRLREAAASARGDA
jgi:hypothetical protein